MEHVILYGCQEPVRQVDLRELRRPVGQEVPQRLLQRAHEARLLVLIIKGGSGRQRRVALEELLDALRVAHDCLEQLTRVPLEVRTVEHLGDGHGEPEDHLPRDRGRHRHGGRAESRDEPGLLQEVPDSRRDVPVRHLLPELILHGAGEEAAEDDVARAVGLPSAVN